MRKNFFLLITFLTSYQINYAQEYTQDSLKKILTAKIHDSTKCSLLFDLIEREENPDVWNIYNDSLYELSTKNLQKAPNSNVFKKHYAAALNNRGYFFNNHGDVPHALENYLASLKIYESTNSISEAAILYNNVARIWNSQGDTEKSIEYYNKSLKNYQILNEETGIAYAYNNLAAVYKKQNKQELALEYSLKSLKLMEKTGNKKGIATSYMNTGTLMAHDKKTRPAGLDYLLKSLEIRENINDYNGIANSCHLIAKTYLSDGNTTLALKYANRSLKVAQELKFPENIRLASTTLKEIYLKKKDYKNAFEMYELSILMSDSIINEENKKIAFKNQLKYEYEKKAVADSIKAVENQKLQDARLAESNAKLKQEKTQRIALYGGVILLIIFGIFMFNRFRVTNIQKKIIEIKEKETQEQKHIIEEKHKEITDSINYAERIQRSFLATKSLLDENLKEYFIIFKPKDIVSGDFYWATKTHNNQFIFVAADSTGHGVPGAIMSLLNITSLEKAIEQTQNPAEILNLTRKTIIERLKKDGSTEGGKDGMDCSIISLDAKSLKVRISAANNPVWIIRKTENDLEPNLIEIKGDKMPVGKHEKDTNEFTLHEVDLIKGDIIYMLTDGFPDQFGGEKGKKFMAKRLKELLLLKNELPMDQQKTELELTFSNWIKNHEQIDDVTLVGIKV